MNWSLLILLALMAICHPTAWAATDRRTVINLNREWCFQLGDFTGAESPRFDDSDWQLANLPHSFSMPYFLSDQFYVGYGWYRKQFTAPADWDGKRVNIEFDGVFQVAEVFVNSQRVGEHRGGYTGFSIDITDALKPGENVLAVRVNNLWDARLAPRAGEHVFSGGIYRNVRLVVTAPLHVAWYGTFVTTPEVSNESGRVNVKTEVVNRTSVARITTVQTQIVDPQGKTVAQMESTQTVPPGVTQVFEQLSESIPNPQLWSPEHPNLYSVKTLVLDEDTPVDDYVSPLGFRWFEFTADRGFFFNGEHRYLLGANAHQDHAGWGDAVTNSGFHRDVKLVKEAGFDFIRGSHYPHSPAFSAACDRLGMLFWSENCFWGTAPFKSPWGASAYPTDPTDESEFEASVKASHRDMIRIHRNHPSIIVWSTGNEVFFSSGSVMPKVQRFLKELADYSRELDPSRPIAIGGCQRGETDKLGDLAGYNGDGARLFPNPGIPNLVAEYGSTIADRPGNYEPGWGDLPTTPGADPNKPYSWRLPWRSGEAIWCAFDHGSIAGHFGAMGMLDHFRLPKRQWYWYRNEYRQIPPPPWPRDGVAAGLKLTADKTTMDSVHGTDDAQIIVTVVDKDGNPLSNCPTVTLNIESGPGEFPTGPKITFAPGSDIAIRDGQAAIEFRSYHAGKTVIRATADGLADATIEITSHGEPAFVAGETAPVKPRTYARFKGIPADGGQMTFGQGNPTRASSEAAEHSGRFANDGDPKTFWQAADGDTNAWLCVDLERIVTVSRVELTFPTQGNWQYKIEISEDGKTTWKPLIDQTQTSESSSARIDKAQGTAQGRFLRVTVTGWPSTQRPAISAVAATGSLSPQ